MKLRTFGKLAGATLSVLVAATTAQAVVVADSSGIIPSTDWLGVGTIRKVGDINDTFVGTAVLIGPHTILTAGHVVDGWTNNQATIVINNQSYTSSLITKHPLYDINNDRYDVAVVTLSSDVAGVTPYAYNTGFVNELTAGPATIVGFGVPTNPATGATTGSFGTKRAGVNKIGMVTTSPTQVFDGQGNSPTLEAGLILFDFDNPSNTLIDPLGDGNALTNEADSTDKDSGAPLFQQFNSQWVITGIAVSGTGSSSYGDIGINVQMADVSAWVAGQVPEPATLCFLFPAAFAMLVRRRRS